MTEKTPQDNLRAQMSKMARKRAGRLIKPTVAEMVHARNGNKAQKRDAMSNVLCRGEPVSDMMSKIGKTRRLKRKRRSR